MNGWVYVMEQRDFDNWLSGNVSGQTPVEAGRDLFENKLGCASCHAGGANQRGAVLEGLFGNQVKLTNGQTIIADEEYIRNSILNPSSQVVAGYQPIMPTFKGQVTEEQLIQLVAYVKSLSGSNNGNSSTSTGGTNTNSGDGNMMRTGEANSNTRANRSDSNSQGSNPNAPSNQPEPTNRQR
jgi:cytochrome c oxidase subunit 2